MDRKQNAWITCVLLVPSIFSANLLFYLAEIHIDTFLTAAIYITSLFRLFLFVFGRNYFRAKEILSPNPPRGSHQPRLTLSDRHSTASGVIICGTMSRSETRSSHGRRIPLIKREYFTPLKQG
jgi:hypothetical protein